jgi:hypothetical protein
LAAVVGLTPAAIAQQFPGIPSPAPAPPFAPVGDVAGVAATPAAPQSNLWSFLLPSQAEKKACRECLRQSQMGLLLNNGLAPVSMFSGGLIPSICPGTPTAQELADRGAIGAAARIKKEEAEAEARRAAVRYLGTVSCCYFPGAEKALIGSLRGDTSECVRWEAALALGSSCCCTKNTIQALADCVSGVEKGGFTAEISPRVKVAAEVALQHCLECYKEVVEAKEPEKKPKGSTPTKPETAPPPVPMARLDPALQQMIYYDQVESKSMAEIVVSARQVLAQLKEKQAAKVPSATKAQPTVLLAGVRSAYNIVTNAIKQPPKPAAASGADGDRLVPQAGRATAVASRPPLIELEEPTDLYHVLMARRQARMREAQARMPSGPVVSAVPTTAENAVKSDLAEVPYSTPSGPGSMERRDKGSAYPAASGYATVGYVLATVNPPLARKADPSGTYHVIGDGVVIPPVSTAEPPAALTKPTAMPYWSNGMPAVPAGRSSYNIIGSESPAALPQRKPQPAAQPYAQFPPLTDPAQRDEPTSSQTQVPPVVPTQPVIQVQAEAPAETQSPLPPTLSGLLLLLQDSPEVSQREWAVTRLAAEDWNGQKEVVKALLDAAHKDPEARVRMLCIRCLVHKKINTVLTIRALQDLKTDVDPQVRQEAAQALAYMMSN